MEKLQSARRCRCLATVVCAALAGLCLTTVTQAQEQARGTVLAPYSVIHSVADLSKSVSFYRDHVGLQVDSVSALPVRPRAAIDGLLAAPRAIVTSATLDIPGSSEKLVLVQLRGVTRRKLDSRLQDPGVVKLVLSVRSVDAEFSAVQPYLDGVYTAGGKPVHPEGAASTVVVTRDPDGFVLEFVLADRETAAGANVSGNVLGGWASFITANIDESVQFYGRQLDFKIGSRRLLPPSSLALEGTPAATVTNVRVMPPGTPNFNSSMYDFRNIARRRLDGNLSDIGTPAMAFRVDDLPAVLTRLRRAGTAVISADGRAVRLADGSQAAFVRDPSGIPIELVQLAR